MVLSKVVCAIFIETCLWVLLVYSFTCATESDIDCLKTLKSQLKDPRRHLSDWEFRSNTDEDYYICNFSGVSCWSNHRVVSIELGGLGLQGEFPIGVKQCSSLQVLNISQNKISGTLPLDIFSFLPYLTILDLSNNRLSGEIPATWSNIAYLNVLLLDLNYFTGQIPTGLASSPRLKNFSVAHNDLQGPIPEFTNGSISILSFEDNPGLCGFPLDTCRAFSIHVAAIAASVFFPVGAAIGWFCVGNGEERKHRPRRH